ncbi:SGNH/GDSL hydrolase family protein [Bacteroides sp. OttesenSCG-928-D19]|nr:SGNH/GDSL hydrolase family protein [Bacteroides sp. OttesenSCG-928-D19]
MKKILLLALAFCSTALYAQDLTQAANLNRYKEANAGLTNKVVFIGNSITQGWADSRPAFFTDNNYIGRGIGGQTSPQLLLRFRQDVINLHPVAVVINIGTNDIAQNTGPYVPEYTMDCIRSMAELAHYNGIKVILSSVTPAAEYPWRKEIKEVPQKIDALNTMIKAYAEAKGFAYIDYNTPMRNEKGGMIKEYTTDEVHVTAKGYEVMEKLAKETINKLLSF